MELISYKLGGGGRSYKRKFTVLKTCQQGVLGEGNGRKEICRACS